jgi:hypothetical protein
MYRTALALALVCAGPAPLAPAGDKIEFPSMRVEGTVVTLDDLKPGDDVVYPVYVGQLDARTRNDVLVIEVKADRGNGRAWVVLKCDKELRDKALKMRGKRVVVEGRGEYWVVTKEVAEMRGDKFYAVKVSDAVLLLTATKIEPAPEPKK